jgi:hypothetical protein
LEAQLAARQKDSAAANATVAEMSQVVATLKGALAESEGACFDVVWYAVCFACLVSFLVSLLGPILASWVPCRPFLGIFWAFLYNISCVLGSSFVPSSCMVEEVELWTFGLLCFFIVDTLI